MCVCQCVCVSPSLCVHMHVCVCLIQGPCQSMSALVLSVSLCVSILWEGVSMSVFVCDCVWCQSGSFCWGPGVDFSVCGSAYIHLPLPVYACVALPASPVACLTQLVPACLPLFASAVCVCLYRGHQAMANELRTV